MEFLVGQSKKWDYQPSMTKHNNSMQIYHITARGRDTKMVFEKIYCPAPLGGLRNNAIQIHVYSNNTIKIPFFLSQLNLQLKIYLFLPAFVDSYLNKKCLYIYYFISLLPYQAKLSWQIFSKVGEGILNIVILNIGCNWNLLGGSPGGLHTVIYQKSWKNSEIRVP